MKNRTTIGLSFVFGTISAWTPFGTLFFKEGLSDSVLRSEPDQMNGRERTRPRPSLSHLFLSFLKLGATAFGGPAMIPYIGNMAVERRQWLDGQTFCDGVALCQTMSNGYANRRLCRLTSAGLGRCSCNVCRFWASGILFDGSAFGDLQSNLFGAGGRVCLSRTSGGSCSDRQK